MSSTFQAYRLVCLRQGTEAWATSEHGLENVLIFAIPTKFDRLSEGLCPFDRPNCKIKANMYSTTTSLWCITCSALDRESLREQYPEAFWSDRIPEDRSGTRWDRRRNRSEGKDSKRKTVNDPNSPYAALIVETSISSQNTTYKSEEW